MLILLNSRFYLPIKQGLSSGKSLGTIQNCFNAANRAAHSDHYNHRIMSQQEYTPYREIARSMDIQKGDVVLLTSDILKLAMIARKAEKEFSTEAFLSSFSDLLGDDGTLLIPAYNFDLEDGDPFSISQTMPMTGSLATAAMSQGTYSRTAHPLHSFLVKGKDAETLEKMSNISSFGPDSPFAWLLEKNALMIFAGTTVAEAMTFTHFVEESEQVWYRAYKRIKIRYTDSEGNTQDRNFKIYAKKPGWTMQLHKLGDILLTDILKYQNINGIPFYTIRCRDAFELISTDITQNSANSIAGYKLKLYFRDIIKSGLNRFNLFRTTYGKIRSAKRIY